MKCLKWISIAYVGLLLLAFVSLFFLGSEKLSFGCYMTDALVIGAECQGFNGASIVGIILNMPLALFFAPMFGVYGLIEGPFFVGNLYVLGIGILMWLPIIFLIYLKLHHGKNI